VARIPPISARTPRSSARSIAPFATVSFGSNWVQLRRHHGPDMWLLTQPQYALRLEPARSLEERALRLTVKDWQRLPVRRTSPADSSDPYKVLGSARGSLSGPSDASCEPTATDAGESHAPSRAFRRSSHRIWLAVGVLPSHGQNHGSPA